MHVKRTNTLNIPLSFAIIAATAISFTCWSASALAEEAQNRQTHIVMTMTAPQAFNGLSVMSTMKIARLMNNLNAQVLTSEVSSSEKNDVQGNKYTLGKVEAGSENLSPDQDRHHTVYVIAGVNDNIHNPNLENE